MAHVIAFLPWAYTDTHRDLGRLRLLPYKNGKLPGDLPGISQADIDGVFSAYASHPKQPIHQATIIEFDSWQSGMDMEKEMITESFRIQNMLAFAALSMRPLFQQHLGYCNFDTYNIVVQRFKPGETGTFAFSTRRRDGLTSQFWSSDQFAFYRPNHVDGNYRISIDDRILKTLLSLPSTHNHIYEAIVEFNSANTDSNNVPEHVEIVMCKTAFECLLGINERVTSLIHALQNNLRGIDPITSDLYLKSPWMQRWPKESRPLFAWVRDFCNVRNNSAHGKTKASPLWKPHQHLAFISILFPLILKKVLADDGRLAMDSDDLEALRRIDQYLINDPFNFNWQAPRATHPWVLIQNQARVAAHANTLYPSHQNKTQ